MNRKLLFGFVIAILSVVLILASCAPAPTTPTTPTTPTEPTEPTTPTEPTIPTEEEAIIIPWGTASCLSGPYAAWGMEEHFIQQIHVEDINEGGGCWGDILGHEPGFRVNGQLYKWNLIAYDAKMDPTEGIKVVNRLIHQDGCQFIHVFMDQVYHAVRPMFLENKVLSTLQGQSPDSMGSDNPYNFRTLLSNPYVNPKVYVPWIYDELEVRSLGCICQNVQLGTLFWQYYEEEFNKLGVDILGAEFYDVGTTDFTAPLAKLVAKNPDMIFLPQPPSEAAGLIVKQARELGYEGILFEGVCPATPTLVDIAGWDALEGFYSVNAVSQPFPYPQQQWFYEEYTKIHGEDSWSGGLFDRADDPYNLTLAIEKANSLDAEAVAAAWESMTSDELFSFFGPDAYMGGTSIWDNNHCLVPRHWVSMITGGKEINLAEVPPPPGI